MKGSSRRTTGRSAYGLLLVTLCAGAGAVTPPPDNARALRAASAVLRLIPGGDIEHSFRPVAVKVVDLDADGTSEVIYLHTSTYTGGSFEQHNGLAVMTALTPDDRRGQPAYPGSSAIDDQDYADIRASGYADDAGAQIPGVLKRLTVKGAAIQVTFESLGDSSFCFAKDREKIGGEPCPPPGTHTWTYRWEPSRLIRTDPPPSRNGAAAGATAP